MKVKGLDNKEYNWNISKRAGKINNNPSNLHIRVRGFLKEIFPAVQVFEELAIPGEQLFIDFYIPSLKLAIEANGIQHNKFVKHFHGNKNNFKKSISRDNRKAEWLKNNGIELIYLNPEETIEQWQTKLEQL